ncbi:hypothetical protein DFJ73DRAFT_946315 [Zopfochytrium polystomum]|nr:hypothetical protein DFJ73DRAFT_946315 [Zopfochytrium polystomum]
MAALHPKRSFYSPEDEKKTEASETSSAGITPDNEPTQAEKHQKELLAQNELQRKQELQRQIQLQLELVDQKFHEHIFTLQDIESGRYKKFKYYAISHAWTTTSGEQVRFDPKGKPTVTLEKRKMAQKALNLCVADGAKLWLDFLSVDQRSSSPQIAKFMEHTVSIYFHAHATLIFLPHGELSVFRAFLTEPTMGLPTRPLELKQYSLRKWTIREAYASRNVVLIEDGTNEHFAHLNLGEFLIAMMQQKLHTGTAHAAQNGWMTNAARLNNLSQYLSRVAPQLAMFGTTLMTATRSVLPAAGYDNTILRLVRSAVRNYKNEWLENQRTQLARIADNYRSDEVNGLFYASCHVFFPGMDPVYDNKSKASLEKIRDIAVVMGAPHGKFRLDNPQTPVEDWQQLVDEYADLAQYGWESVEDFNVLNPDDHWLTRRCLKALVIRNDGSTNVVACILHHAVRTAFSVGSYTYPSALENSRAIGTLYSYLSLGRWRDSDFWVSGTLLYLWSHLYGVFAMRPDERKPRPFVPTLLFWPTQAVPTILLGWTFVGLNLVTACTSSSSVSTLLPLISTLVALFAIQNLRFIELSSKRNVTTSTSSSIEYVTLTYESIFLGAICYLNYGLGFASSTFPGVGGPIAAVVITLLLRLALSSLFGVFDCRAAVEAFGTDWVSAKTFVFVPGQPFSSSWYYTSAEIPSDVGGGVLTRTVTVAGTGISVVLDDQQVSGNGSKTIRAKPLHLVAPSVRPSTAAQDLLPSPYHPNQQQPTTAVGHPSHPHTYSQTHQQQKVPAASSATYANHQRQQRQPHQQPIDISIAPAAGSTYRDNYFQGQGVRGFAAAVPDGQRSFETEQSYPSVANPHTLESTDQQQQQRPWAPQVVPLQSILTQQAGGVSAYALHSDAAAAASSQSTQQPQPVDLRQLGYSVASPGGAPFSSMTASSPLHRRHGVVDRDESEPHRQYQQYHDHRRSSRGGAHGGEGVAVVGGTGMTQLAAQPGWSERAAQTSPSPTKAGPAPPLAAPPRTASILLPQQPPGGGGYFNHADYGGGSGGGEFVRR